MTACAALETCNHDSIGSPGESVDRSNGPIATVGRGTIERCHIENSTTRYHVQ